MKSMNLFGGNDKSSGTLFGDTKPKKKTYTEDFKKKAVKLASKVGVTKAAEELGISTSSIYSWKKTLAKSPMPIQDKEGNLTFSLEGKTYSLNVYSEKERERVKEEVNANSLTQYAWFKEDMGKEHWVFYNTEMYEVSCDIWRKHFLHYKENSNLAPIIPVNGTSCHSMFSDCESLTQLDLSSFDTSKVVDMNYMFEYCSSLTSLNLSNFDTSQVINMKRMFLSCRRLISLDLSNFDTSSVTNMSHMFYDCSRLTVLDLSNFNTGNVTDMSYMFYECSRLTVLDLSNFNTGNVTDMSYMFYGCLKLISLDLSNFDTSNATNMRYMFCYCVDLNTIYVSNKWSVNNITESEEMFISCYNLPNYNSYKTKKINAHCGKGGYLTLK